MEYEEGTLNFCDTSSNMSEEEVDLESEQQVCQLNNQELNKHGVSIQYDESNKNENVQRVLEKRSREEELVEDEQGFVTVQRGPKRLARSFSKGEGIMEFKVCITSKEILPKQFGMAKLLRSMQIEDINRIKYKNAYRALVTFEKQESANRLLECEELANLGYRIQPSDEIILSYGIVRQVDLCEQDEEILKNLTSEYNIISVRRLKRLNEKGEWINSETIRLAFKSPTLPPYVYGFGCRFKVEKYTFPVSQCSVCWKFGHLSRSCPTKKIICPKCSDNHTNCETLNYTCVNCKGPHMALYKKCPIFLKEKEIRNIMAEKNCTYRNALKIYLSNREDRTHELSDENFTEKQRTNMAQTPYNRSYRDVVVEAVIHRNTEDDDENISSIRKVTNRKPIKSKGSKKVAQREENLLQLEEIQVEKSSEENSRPNENQPREKEPRDHFDWNIASTLKKVKDIFKTNDNLESKLKLIFSLLVEQVWQIIVKFIQSGEVCNKIFSSLFNE